MWWSVSLTQIHSDMMTYDVIVECITHYDTLTMMHCITQSHMMWWRVSLTLSFWGACIIHSYEMESLYHSFIWDGVPVSFIHMRWSPCIIHSYEMESLYYSFICDGVPVSFIHMWWSPWTIHSYVTESLLFTPFLVNDRVNDTLHHICMSLIHDGLIQEGSLICDGVYYSLYDTPEMIAFIIHIHDALVPASLSLTYDTLIEWLMSHVWMSHGTQLQWYDSSVISPIKHMRDSFELLMAHEWLSHGTQLQWYDSSDKLYQAHDRLIPRPWCTRDRLICIHTCDMMQSAEDA